MQRGELEGPEIREVILELWEQFQRASWQQSISKETSIPIDGERCFKNRNPTGINIPFSLSTSIKMSRGGWVYRDHG